MKHKQVISQFQDWFEDRLSDEQRSQLQEHLEHCPECKSYFERMALLLQAPEDDLFPELQADPYMATRIKSQVKNKKAIHLHHPAQWLKWIFIGAATSMAILIGVEMGNSLYTVTQNSYTNDEIAVTYYKAFSQNEIADQWQEVINTKEDSKK